MTHAVLLTREAEDDLFDLHCFVAATDSPARADELLDRLEGTVGGLVRLPRRGHVPPELDRIGVMEFREIRFKPYRIIYEIVGTKVLVHAILDGRRDLQDLLARRLLR